jgi:YD repeat-containing protein
VKITKLYIAFLVAVSLVFLGSVIQAGTINYTYDELNRLISAEKPNEYRIEYYYDAAGNRTAKVVELTTPSFDYDEDGDVDGADLARFCTEWDGSSQMLENFAQVFGSN